jgi:hypothetical protein
MTELCCPKGVYHAKRPRPREAPPARRQGVFAVAFGNQTVLWRDERTAGPSTAFGAMRPRQTPLRMTDLWCTHLPLKVLKYSKRHVKSGLRFGGPDG